MPSSDAPFGWDVYTHTEVIPKPDPKAITLHWRIVPGLKPADWVAPEPTHPSYVPEDESEITLQLTADQMVTLTVAPTDKYGNPVDLTGDAVWQSSDESIVSVNVDAGGSTAPTSCQAIAVGPTGTASVTFTNDADRNGTGDYIGSIAIDVVAGEMAEIEISAGQPVPKDPNAPRPEQRPGRR
jgi:hypothetical protein